MTFGIGENFNLVEQESEAARTGAALFDQSYLGTFYVDGPDAYKCVQYLCGSNLEGKKDGSITYTVLCNEKGGVEADLTVARINENSWYFISGGQTFTKVSTYIHAYIHAYIHTYIHTYKTYITIHTIHNTIHVKRIKSTY